MLIRPDTQRFEIYGDPVPQSRPRFYRRGSFVGAYDEDKKAKEACAFNLKRQGALYWPDDPLWVYLYFFMPRPKRHYGKKGLKKGAPRFCNTRPDLDNLCKHVLDAAKGLVYRDDNLIISIHAIKFYINKDGAKTIFIVAKTEQNMRI